MQVCPSAFAFPGTPRLPSGESDRAYPPLCGRSEAKMRAGRVGHPSSHRRIVLTRVLDSRFAVPRLPRSLAARTPRRALKNPLEAPSSARIHTRKRRRGRRLEHFFSSLLARRRHAVPGTTCATTRGAKRDIARTAEQLPACQDYSVQFLCNEPGQPSAIGQRPHRLPISF